jgi:hypothetical protein
MPHKKKTTKRSTPKRSTHGGPTALRMSTERIKLNRGGYDALGRYYGTGEKLWRVTVTDQTSGLNDEQIVRAPTQRDAKAQVTQNLIRALGMAQPEQHGAAKRMISTEGPAPHEVVNLEGLSDSELAAISSSRQPQQIRELAQAFMAAREARLRGNIQAALRHEQHAQRLYDRLPGHLRW